MGLTVTFGSVTLPNVRSIQKGSTVSTTVWNDQTLNKGLLLREITVDGLIFTTNRAISNAGIVSAISAYDALESSLRSVGNSSLVIGSLSSISDCRVSQVNFDQYPGNPVLFYTVKFLTTVTNPFAETVTLTDSGGTTTFDPIPQITDQFVRQDGVIAWDSQGTSAAKQIRLRGRFTGTVVQLGSTEDEIKARLTTYPTMTLVIPSGTYTVKCQSFTFTTPDSTSRDDIKDYEIELFTEKNYTLESENLPNTPVTIAGVTFTVLESYASSISRVNNNGVYEIETEELNISGQVHFASFAAAEAYASAIASVTLVPNTLLSVSGKSLVATSINIGTPKREGRLTTGAQKYIVTISISLQWIISLQDKALSSSESIFGVNWFTISSKGYGGNVNVCGLKTQDTLNISGKVSSIPAIEVGNSYSYNGKQYYLTGVNFGSRDNQGRYDLSVTGRTLDTFEQAEEFLTYILPVSGQFINELTSFSKSVNYKYTSTVGYKATSVTINISGFIYVGSGSANGVLNMINEFSQFTGGGLNSYRVTSVSVGNKQKFIDLVGCAIGQKQSVTVGYIINFEPDGNSSGRKPATEAKIIEEQSVEIQQILNKYTQIQIPGGALYFKKTGLIPGKVTIKITRRRVGGSATQSFDYPPIPGPPGGPEEMFLSDSKQSSTGTTRSSSAEYTVIKGTVNAVAASGGTVVGTIAAEDG